MAKRKDMPAAEWGQRLTSAPGSVVAHDYALLQLAEERQDSDGRIYQHLVCSNCMELVEQDPASEQVHECSGILPSDD